MEDFFYKLNHKSNYLSDYCLKEITPKDITKEVFGWRFERVKNEIWKNDSVLRKIDEKFPIKGIAVIHMKPNMCYKWHTDAYRLCALNLLLTANESSYTVFTNDYHNAGQDQIDITRLKYEPDYFYIFNTRKSHTVLNLNEDRYMITCEFYDNEVSDYSSLVKYCKEIGL